MKYKITFSGKKRGAIGIFQQFEEIVCADNEEKAQLKLYEKYDHIRIKEILILS